MCNSSQASKKCATIWVGTLAKFVVSITTSISQNRSDRRSRMMEVCKSLVPHLKSMYLSSNIAFLSLLKIFIDLLSRFMSNFETGLSKIPSQISNSPFWNPQSLPITLKLLQEVNFEQISLKLNWANFLQFHQLLQLLKSLRRANKPIGRAAPQWAFANNIWIYFWKCFPTSWVKIILTFE